jgi:hypothetical protein
MAASAAASARSTYPAPPPVYKLYTSDSKTTRPELWDPPAPLTGPFTKLGLPQSDEFLAHHLEDGVTRLYEEEEGPRGGAVVAYTRELRRLNGMVVSQYRSIIDRLITGSAEDVSDEVDKFAHVFFNITHLLTMLRPHQARQKLIVKKQKQIARQREKLDRIMALTREVDAFFATREISFASPDSAEPILRRGVNEAEPAARVQEESMSQATSQRQARKHDLDSIALP